MIEIIFNKKYFKTKILPIVLFIFLFFITFSHQIQSEVKKIWEIDNDKIFDQELRRNKRGYILRPEGKINPFFTPSAIFAQIITASDEGVVKELNADTKRVKKIIKIPLKIEEGDLYGWTNIFFFGKHKNNDKYYTCCIDLKTKRIKGIIKRNKKLWTIKDFAIYCENNTIFVVSPMKGRVVYTQEIDKNFIQQVKSRKKNKFVFLNDSNELIELILPEWAIALLFATTQPQKGERKRAVLNFRTIAALDEKIKPNYLHKKLVYFNTKNSLGCYDLRDDTIVWEIPLTKPYTVVSEPLVIDDVLIYLTSRSANSMNNSGKIVAVGRKEGKVLWTTDTFPFARYKLVEFKKMLIIPDKNGNVLFCNPYNGKVKHKFAIGDKFTTPYIEHEMVYIQTKDKLFRFDYK